MVNGSVTEDSEVEEFEDKIEEEKNENEDEKKQLKNDSNQVDKAVTLTTASEPPKLS